MDGCRRERQRRAGRSSETAEERPRSLQWPSPVGCWRGWDSRSGVAGLGYAAVKLGWRCGAVMRSLFVGSGASQLARDAQTNTSHHTGTDLQ